MVYKIIITPEAEEDLEDIHSYILNRFLAPQAARQTLMNIKLSIQKIAEYPSLGIDVSERVGRQFSSEHQLRMTIAGSYLVFYIVDDHSVVVLRILYQRQNWIDLFK